MKIPIEAAASPLRRRNAVGRMLRPSRTVAAVLAALAGFFAAAPAVAQQPPRPSSCAPFAEMRHHLAVRYGEAPVGFGIHTSGALMQVFAAEATGTWTLVLTSPRGRACIIGAGTGWEALEPTIEEDS